MRLGTEGTLWVLLSLLLALFVPQISYVISPIGGLAAILMFVFPGRHNISTLIIMCCDSCLSSPSNELAALDSNTAVPPEHKTIVYCVCYVWLVIGARDIYIWD